MAVRPTVKTRAGSETRAPKDPGDLPPGVQSASGMDHQNSKARPQATPQNRGQEQSNVRIHVRNSLSSLSVLAGM